jgi:hypothetical protein
MRFCGLCGAKFAGNSRFCRKCGAALFAISAPSISDVERPSRPIATLMRAGCATAPPKKLALAVVLAALFGPLGLLYASVTGALYMVLAWCFLVLATCKDWVSNDLVAFLIAWPICIVWAILAASAYNEDRR